jgi:glutamate racemase
LANQPIGVFDSGIGGLTVASSIKGLLPKETLIYFGDTVHLPYGDKSEHAIESYVKTISGFLFEQNCKCIVVACNSASSVLSDKLLEHIPIPVLNVIDPVIELVASNKAYKSVGVIGTKRTIDSGIYGRKIKEIRPDIHVVEIATPLLAPMIEEGFHHGEIAHSVIAEYLGDLEPIDALILGCTHYPLIKEEIRSVVGKSVELLDAPELVAKALVAVLSERDARNEGIHSPSKFYVSDLTDSFQATAETFFGRELHLVEHAFDEG